MACCHRPAVWLSLCVCACVSLQASLLLWEQRCDKRTMINFTRSNLSRLCGSAELVWRQRCGLCSQQVCCDTLDALQSGSDRRRPFKSTPRAPLHHHCCHAHSWLWSHPFFCGLMTSCIYNVHLWSFLVPVGAKLQFFFKTAAELLALCGCVCLWVCADQTLSRWEQNQFHWGSWIGAVNTHTHTHTPLWFSLGRCLPSPPCLHPYPRKTDLDI